MVKVLDSKDGYNLYSENYKNDYKELDSFDRKEFLSFLPDRAETVVELGIGDGRISREVARISNHFIGFDIADQMLIQAKKQVPSSDLIVSDLAYSIPLKSASVDLVVAAFFFVHIADPESVIAEVERILKPGGIFLFNLIPQRRELVLKAGKEKFKVKSYYHSPPKIEKALEYNWFETESEVIEDDTGKKWYSIVVKSTKS